MKRSIKANLKRMENVGKRLYGTPVTNNPIKGSAEDKLEKLIEKAKKEGMR